MIADVKTRSKKRPNPSEPNSAKLRARPIMTLGTPQIDARIAELARSTGSTPEKVVKQSVSGFKAKFLRKRRKNQTAGPRPNGVPALPWRKIMQPKESGRIDPERARATIMALIREREKNAAPDVD